MKIGKDEVFRIADLALSIYQDQSKYLSWENQTGSISSRERRALAYTEAVKIVLGLDLDIEYYKQIDTNTWDKVE